MPGLWKARGQKGSQSEAPMQ
ncbi:hypothetical protein EVAR_72751_1, partial [Eumeta japonica]